VQHPASVPSNIPLSDILSPLQFAVSVAALTVSAAQRETILSTGWCKLDAADKGTIQMGLGCFGFSNMTVANATGTEPACMAGATGRGQCPGGGVSGGAVATTTSETTAA